MAKRALVTLCELHRREVWFDDRTANAICTACFHPVSRLVNFGFCLRLCLCFDPGLEDNLNGHLLFHN